MPGYAVIHPKNNKVLAFVSASKRGMPNAFGRATELAAHYAAKDNMKIAVVASISNLKKGHFVSDLYFFGGPYVLVDGRLNIYSHSGMPPKGTYEIPPFDPEKEMPLYDEDETDDAERAYGPHRARYHRKDYDNPPAHRTGARLHPDLRFWQRAFHQATNQPGEVSAVFPYLYPGGGLAIFVRVKTGRGTFDTWSPYFEQHPDPIELQAARNDPDGWISGMEGATEWEQWEWFQV